MATHPLVLLVEPNALLRELIRGELKEQGCIVVDAETQDSALRFATLYPGFIDLAVTDIVSGPEDDRAFVEKLRALPAGRSTKVIHVVSLPTDAPSAADDSSDRYLPARFDRRTLLDALRGLLPAAATTTAGRRPKRAVFWGAERSQSGLTSRVSHYG